MATRGFLFWRRLWERQADWRIIQAAKLKWRLAKLLPLYTRHKYLARFALRKANSAFRYSTMFLSLLAVSFYFVSQGAEAAVTVDTSGISSATNYSFQRKTWHDGTRYWVGFLSSTSGIEFWYSVDGTTWTQNTSGSFSESAVQSFSILGNSNELYIAEGVGVSGITNIVARKAISYPSTSFTWSSSTQVLSTGGVNARYPVISQDTSGKLRITAAGGAGTVPLESKLSTNPNDVTSWGSVETLDSSANSNKYGDIAPLGSSDMYSVWTDGTSIEGKKNTAGTWDTNPIAIATGTTGVTNNMSMVSNTTTDEAYLSYIDSGGKNVFQKYVDKQGGDGINIDDAGDPGTMSGAGRKLVRTSTGTLYAFINDGGTCEIWKSADNGSNWTQQDIANSITCTNAQPVALAVDSTDILHLIFMNNSPILNLRYKTFSTSTDTFVGSEENVETTASTPSSMEIEIDSVNKPHLVITYSNGGSGYAHYENRVTGSWSGVGVDFIDPGGIGYGSIVINEDDVPEVAYTSGTTLKAAIGVCSGTPCNNPTSFTLHIVDASVQATSGTAGTSIGIDSLGNTWVAYIDENVSDYVFVVKHNDADGWTTWQSPQNWGQEGREPSLAISGNTLHVLYQDNSNDIAVNTNADGTITGWGGVNTLKTGTFQDASARWAYNANYKHAPLDFLYSDGTDIFYSNTGFWNPPITIDSNSGNAYTSVTRHTTTGTLYAFWIRSNVLYQSSSVSPYTSWSAPTSVYSTGTNAYSSTTTSFSGCNIPVMFTNGVSNPYSVMFEKLAINCPPGAPTLTTLYASGTTVASVNPPLQMAATDPESNAIKYKIYIYNTTANDGTNCLGSSFVTADQNDNGTGWDNGTTAYSSGATATYTVQSAMTRGDDYCWQAQAKDPSGSNSFGTLSAPSTFTVNSLPGTPTLTQPVSSATNVSLTPEFRFAASDADSDYLRYKVYIYDNTCTNLVGGSAIIQPSNAPQPGWVGQSSQSGTAYAPTQTAIYIHPTTLAALTTYCWKVEALDPGGSALYGGSSATRTFTTSEAPKQEINIGGSTTIHGGTTIGN